MITLTPPPQSHMRYHDVVAWLTDNGFSIYEIRRWIDKGVIEAHFPERSRRAWYNTEQIQKALSKNTKEKTENG